jgi:hypothetical protein
MEKFIDYIESQMSGVPDGPFLYKFKRKTLDEMNGRASEVEARGLRDKNVIDDLIISEHPDLKSDYKKFALESKRKNTSKRRWLTNSIGSVLYLIILLCAYLGMSFHTHNWEKTWVFMVGGVLLWVVYLLSLFIIRISRMRQIFHIFARLMLAGSVMLVATVVFICSLEFFRFEGYWSIFVGGVAVALIADAVYATVTNKKLVMFSYLLYIPIIGTMVYIILAAVGAVNWNNGWLIIIFSLMVDVAVAVSSIVKNSVEKWEVVNAWKDED